MADIDGICIFLHIRKAKRWAVLCFSSQIVVPWLVTMHSQSSLLHGGFRMVNAYGV